MKKQLIVIMLMIITLFLTGCKNNSSKQFENNKNQNTQINEKNPHNESNVKPDNYINNESENSSSDSNQKYEDSNNNTPNHNKENIKENNTTSSNINSNDNTNINDKDNTNTESSKLPKEIEPTIEYACYNSDEVYKNGLCSGYYTYIGTLNSSNPYTCPNGYIYKSDKCYIMKEPNVIKYCDHEDYILDGDLCLGGNQKEAGITNLYYMPEETSIANYGISYSFISKSEGYKEYAQIKCFSHHSKINDSETLTSYCLNNKGERVKPQSANCEKNGLKLINNENVYQCAGTEYKYYYCNGKLVGTTCFPGKRANFGMYCDDDSRIENGKCHYVTNVNPEANYSCRAGDKKVEEEKQMCIHNYTTEPQKIYKCPKGYFLGTDQKCYLV